MTNNKQVRAFIGAMETRYKNSDHFLFSIADGKIARMKDDMDTSHANPTFGR